jgi:hypothetical protein
MEYKGTQNDVEDDFHHYHVTAVEEPCRGLDSDQGVNDQSSYVEVDVFFDFRFNIKNILFYFTHFFKEFQKRKKKRKKNPSTYMSEKTCALIFQLKKKIHIPFMRK